MPISPEYAIRAASDGWVAVRDDTGRLLGVIPGDPPQQDFIQAPPPLGAVACWSVLTYCCRVTAEQVPLLRQWQGFIPVDDMSTQADLAQPVGDTDLGEPI